MALLEVKTNYGVVRGVRANNPGYSIFKGVPYAAPPVGDKRFAPPQKLESWEGVLDCSRWQNTCMQAPGSFGFYAKEFYPEPKQMDENCLYLNIWTPANSADEKLPVFFWIHGGGYGGGYSYEMEFDGEAMCKRGCILVSIEYRCNCFGFFAHPELTARNGRSGNAGMEDQIAALQWTYENIAYFGGDPENITVHGQSAGAMSTRTLLASPRCKGILNRVIVQSGGGINDWSNFNTMEQQEAIGVQLLEEAGMRFDEIMSLPAKEVYARMNAAAGKLYPMGGDTLCFHPCVDGYSLTEGVGVSIEAGRVNTQSIMCGSVSGDFGLSAKLNKEDPDLKQKQRVAAFSSQVAWGEHQIEKGRAPIYSYFFERNLPGDNLGAFHSSELWYMFGSLHRAWRPWTGYDYELSDAMVSYWCNFARTGNPNAEGLPEWPAYTADTPLTMNFADGGYGTKNLLEEPFAKQLQGPFRTPGYAGKL